MTCRMRARGTTPASGVTSTQSSAMQALISEISFEVIARLKVSSTRASSAASAGGVASEFGEPDVACMLQVSANTTGVSCKELTWDPFSAMLGWISPDMADGSGLRSTPHVVVTRHSSALGSWELATGVPAEVLRPFAREYVGWHEHLTVPLCRRELPTEEVPLIINFGAPFHLFTPSGTRRDRDLASFVTG